MKHTTMLMLISASACCSACIEQDMLFPTMGDVESMSTRQLGRHLRETERTIQERNPSISDDILESDKSLIAAYIVTGNAGRHTPTSPYHRDERLDYGEIRCAWTALRTGPDAIRSDHALDVDNLQGLLARMGQVRFKTKPKGALVKLNCDDVGNTPCKDWRPGGTYPYRITLPGYVTVEDDVDIIPGETTKIEKRLRKR